MNDRDGLELRGFHTADFPRLIGWIDSPLLLFQWAGTRFTYPLDDEQLGRHVRRSTAPGARVAMWKAVLAATEEPVGHVELEGVDSPGGAATLRRVFVAPEWRGRGLATSMVAAVLDVAFGSFARHRIGVWVLDFNRAGIALYERLGFIHEGVLREACSFNGRRCDTLAMGMLATEWLAGTATRLPAAAHMA